MLFLCLAGIIIFVVGVLNLVFEMDCLGWVLIMILGVLIFISPFFLPEKEVIKTTTFTSSLIEDKRVKAYKPMLIKRLSYEYSFWSIKWLTKTRYEYEILAVEK